MRTSHYVRRSTVTSLSLLALLSACQDPTQITIEVTTDLPCDQRLATGISVGELGAIESKPAAATKEDCAAGRIGSLVAVPAGEGSTEVAFRIVTSVGGELSACETPTAGDDCIVSRRVLGYLDHKKLLVPVVQRDACRGVPCDQQTTCVRGDCVPARIDPALCSDADGCGETELGSGAGGAGGMGGAGGAGGSGGGSPPALWSSAFGPDSGLAIAVASNDDVIVGAHIADVGYDFGGGIVSDLAIVRFDPAGNYVWDYSSIKGDTVLHAIALDAEDNVYFVGEAQGVGDYGRGDIGGMSLADMLIGCVNSDRTLRWARSYGASMQGVSHRLTDVAVGPSGAVYAVGQTGGGDVNIPPGLPADSIAVAEFDGGGNVLTARAFSGTTSALYVAVDSAGFVYLAGSFVNDVTFPPMAALTSAGGSDLFVAKLSPAFDALWAQRYGGPSDQILAGMEVDAAGNIYLLFTSSEPVNFGGNNAGSAGMQDVYVASLDPAAGAHRWQQLTGTVGDDVATALAISPAGNLFVGVHYDGNVALRSLSPAMGQLRWHKTYGIVGSQRLEIEALAASATVEVAATGSFSGTINLGSGELVTSNEANNQGFVVSYPTPPQ